MISGARQSLRLGAFGGQDPQVRGVRTDARTIWLLFLLFPVLTALGSHGTTLGRVLIMVGAVAFIAVYLVLVLSWHRSTRPWRTVALLGVLIGISIALTAAAGPGWGFLFIYCAATAALVSEPRTGFAAVISCTALAGGLTALAGGSSGTCISFLTSTAGIGLLMLLMRDLRVRNEELTAARAELARLAVAQERERFARDLHDLLGHTLSVIAIKAELAGRLLPERREEAAQEVADLERVARSALSEVREAVSGYRRPTLDDELAGAEMALSAAGIVPVLERESVALDAAGEAVLAWAVREGATNVIRHSRARRCWVTVRAQDGAAAVEIVDDGGATPGDASGQDGHGGNGLAGLAERARAVGGSMRAGRREGAPGFGLTVAVPLG